MSNNKPPVPQFDQQAIFEAMLNPLGSLNLSATETKMLFFRHLGAEYAQAAKRGRVPYANQIVKAGQSFGGLGGGMDPMMMFMMNQMFNPQPQPAPITAESIATAVATALEPIVKRLDDIEGAFIEGA